MVTLKVKDPGERATTIILFIILTGLAFVWLLPFFIVINTSLRTQHDLVARGVFVFPENLEFKNFVDAWTIGKFNKYYRNSLLITFTKVPLGLFFAAMAAYPLAKLKFKFSDPIFVFFLIGLGIPAQVVLLPLTIIMKTTNLLNTPLALILPYIAFGLSLQVLVLRGFFRGIPNELIDASRMDGANEFRILVSVIFPISSAVFSALFIIDFLSTWNEFLMALTFLSGDTWRTVPVGMMNFLGEHGTSYPHINAGVLVSIIPVIAVYLGLQKHFVSGMISGAIKQ